jgi:hypothetical protein
MAKDFEFFHTAWLVRTGCILTGVVLFVAISMWVYMPWWELALRSDKSPVSWLSSALLFACAALALQICASQTALSKAFSAWLAIAMLALSLDEQFMFHEYWKHHCFEWLVWCGAAIEGQVDWLGDAPMLVVGLVGIATFSKLYRAIKNPVARRLVLASLLVGVLLALGTHFGHAGGVFPAWFNRFEEVFEVLAESLFLCALLEVSVAPFSKNTDQVQSASSL